MMKVPKHHAVLLTAAQFGSQGGLSAITFAQIATDWAGITLRVPACFENEEEFWTEAQAHPDIWMAARDKNQLNLDDLMGLKDRTRYAPQLAERRLFFIDGAHRLSVNAANSLLKVLEEPPIPSLFVLTARSKHSVLSTITSRCQHLDVSKEAGASQKRISTLDEVSLKKITDVFLTSSRYVASVQNHHPKLGALIQLSESLSQNCQSRDLLDHLALLYPQKVNNGSWTLTDLRMAVADLRNWEKALDWNCSSTLWLTRIFIAATL